MLLAIVPAVLRHQREPGVLQHVSAQISSFLGSPPCLSLSQACSFGSTRLLDWIWDLSCTSVSNRPSTWPLHNYLRSDLHYNGDQFIKSLEVAVRREDLAIVKWLFAHFSGFEVPAEVVISAASAGNLPILQFFLDNDTGCEGGESKSQTKRKIVEKNNLSEAVGGHGVHWTAGVMMSVLRAEDPEIVQWLHGNMPAGVDEQDIDRVIRFSLRGGDDKIAKTLMPKGRCVLD
ncbi:hypothetical protein JG688_00016050 [Phytophthora aleatoria]|uniref:Uncharacterized protein n=1 Tax=Phytophthora aleatoria TaxID=2496075 RepID=A0A8J5IUS2_9STRA|nr:hypothetical protein JG688_00016050 [Phytophthora aleatoria]